MILPPPLRLREREERLERRGDRLFRPVAQRQGAARRLQVQDEPLAVLGGRLADPTSPDTVFVSSSAGIYRTTDAGRCWVSLLAGTNVSDMTLVQTGVGQTILYAAIAGPTNIGTAVVRTTNANADAANVTWSATPELVRNLPSGARISTIPALGTPISKIALTSSKNVVYAIVAQGASATSKYLRVFRTTTSDVWVEQAEPLDAGGNNRCDGQCNYDLAISASRLDENDVVVGTVTVFRSTDGGKRWSELNPGSSSLWDHHVIVHHPTDPDLVLSGGDAGIQRIQPSHLGNADGFWQYINSGLNNLLFEGLALSNGGRPWKSIGGLQDRGTLIQVEGRYWTSSGGGDGLRAEFDGNANYPAFFTSSLANTGRVFQRAGGAAPMTGLGDAVAFWTDPEHAGVMIGSNPIVPPGSGTPNMLTGLYWASGLTSANQANWTCIDPLPGTPGTFSGAIAFLPGVGRYLVGSTTGSVFLINAPASASTVSRACAATSTVSSSQLWTAPSSVTGLAIPSASSFNVFYAVLYRYDESRIMAVRRSVVPSSRGGLTIVWRATPIAGLPGQPGSFPVTGDSCCPGQFGFVSPIAVDPEDAGILYVGTQTGLVVGRAQPDGTWQWAFDKDVPETWVNDIQVRRGAQGAGSVVRLSTYGRGVYERVPQLRRAALAGSQIANIRAIRAPLPARCVSELNVVVDYAYHGTTSVTLRLRPAGPVRDRVFASTPVHVQRGTGTAVLSLAYTGDGGPLEISTRGLIVEMVRAGGTVLVSRQFARLQRWKRLDARRVTVIAEATSGEGAPVPVTVRVTTVAQGRTSAADAPVTLAVLEKTRLLAAVPATLRIGGTEVRFVGWKDIIGSQGLRPELTLEVSDDLDLTAVYAVPK
jgi:hypothetical protein